MSFGKRFLSHVSADIAWLKNTLYDYGIFDAVALPVPVISVGNLTFGGTGKTPCIRLLLDMLLAEKKRVVVVSRNYRAEVKTWARVNIHRANFARFYGDEPALLAGLYPQVDVFVGPSKWETALHAYGETHPDVILVDDGFQHRRLQRNLDIVLLDCTRPVSAYQTFPMGEARESFAGLKRADVIILTKSNLCAPEHLAKLQSLLPPGIPALQLEYRLPNLKALQSKKVMGLAAVANPQSFKQMLQGQGLQLVDFLQYKDHHRFSIQDAQMIRQRFDEMQSEVLLVTEKDEVKLREFASCRDIMQSVALGTNLVQGQKELHAFIHRIFD